MITEIDLSQYYIKKQEIESAFEVEGDAATIIKNAIAAKPNLGTSHNDAARGDHNHDGAYLKSYTPPVASTTNAGIVQLNTSTNDLSVSQAATPSAVKAAYDLAQNKTVTVTKLGTATTGYLATYEIKQGGTLLGKIEIPKDYLIRSGTVKESQADNNPEPGYNKGDKYIDFLINVKEGSDSKSHIYVNLRDLVDVYKADGSSLQLIGDTFSIKENGVKASHIESGAIENRHISINAQIPFSKLNITKQDIVGLEIPAYDTDTLYYGDETTIELGNNNRFKVKDNVFADKSHNHGEISSSGTIGSSPNKPLITGESGKITTGTFGNQPNTFSEGNHTHGSILNNGKLNDDTQNPYKVVVTDTTQNIKTIEKNSFSSFLPNATSNSKGVVKLNNTIADNSEEAATAHATYLAYQKANHEHPYIRTDAGSVGTSNLASKSVTNDKLKPTPIQNGTNLNNITTPGFYYSYYNADTLKNVPKSPDLNGTYDEAIAFTMVVSGEEEGRILTQTLTYQSDYGDSLKTTQFVRTKNINWSGWVLSACSRPIELYSNEYFYLIVNPVGRTATVTIYGNDKNFGNTLTDNKIVRYFTLNGNISASNVQVIPSGYRPHSPIPLSFVAWKSGIVGRVMKDGSIRIAVNRKGVHDIHASATWVY